MTVLLIRHGETDLNAARVVQFPDTPLGSNGKLQAQHLGTSLKARPIELILTSDYRRARMTAEYIAEHVNVALVESANLRERNFGDHRGQAYDDLGDLDIFAPGYQPPGGESWEMFNARVDLAWAEILQHAHTLSGDLAVVTHGLVLRSLFERTLDRSAHDLDCEVVVANTSITIVEHAAPWRILELASTAHLNVAPRVGGPA